jgi:putative DNA primase/helicase
MCRCPAHDDNHPSLKVSQEHGRALFYCHTGCTQEAVIEALRARGIWPERQPRRLSHRAQYKYYLSVLADERLGEEGEADDGQYEVESEIQKYCEGPAVLRLAAQTQDGQPTTYLAARCIRQIPPAAMLVPAKAFKETGARLPRFPFPNYPAMVLPVLMPEGPPGVQVTWLTRDRMARLQSRFGETRRFYGRVRGGYIPLWPEDQYQDPFAKLLIGEGVETTLSAIQIAGLPGIAALSTTGMKAVEPPRANEYIIVADHDASGAGEKAARALAERLANRGRIVRLTMPQKEGQDFNDVLRQANSSDLELIRAEILEARRIRKSQGVQPKTMGEFLDTPSPPVEYLLNPILESPATAMLHAKRGSGKTYFGLAIGHAIATGQGLLGWKVTQAKRVLYVDGELPRRKLQRRLRLLGPLTPDLCVLSRDDLMRDQQLRMPDLGMPEGRQWLNRIIEDGKFDVIILDSVSTLVRSGVENEAESWAPIQDWMLQDHRFHDRSVIVIHHEGRSGQARGTSKREDALDTVMRLQERRDLVKGDESVFELSFPKARDFFGEDLTPRLLHLSIKDGVARWSEQSLQANTKERVAELLASGLKQSDIAQELGLSKGRVSQIVKEL